MPHAEAVAPRALVGVPADLRPRLEAARLDLLALFRALDQRDLSPAEIPQRLIQRLFELDADCVEALWAIDQAAPENHKMQAVTVNRQKWTDFDPAGEWVTVPGSLKEATIFMHY